MAETNQADPNNNLEDSQSNPAADGNASQDTDQQEHVEAAADFIANTSLDKMLEISQERFLKQMQADAEAFEFKEPPELPSFGSSDNA